MSLNVKAESRTTYCSDECWKHTVSLTACWKLKTEVDHTADCSRDLGCARAIGYVGGKLQCFIKEKLPLINTKQFFNALNDTVNNILKPYLLLKMPYTFNSKTKATHYSFNLFPKFKGAISRKARSMLPPCHLRL